VERDEEDRYPYCNLGTCCLVLYCWMSTEGLKTGTATGTNLGAVIYRAVLATGKPAAAVLLGLSGESRSERIPRSGSTELAEVLLRG
jgi:hypothetical protein